MHTVKSLLLGSAAGLVAVAGAQAADMPVKAAPVQYVKICSLYGDGFYYIPGTDTCLKLGGYLRVQAEYNAGGGGVTDGTLNQTAQAMYDRVRTNDIDFRVRAAVSWDVRQQTQYGTLRTYIRLGIQQTTPADPQAGAVFWDRAFMQFAGFTVGKAQSFYDTVTYGGAYSYHNVRTVSDTGASGVERVGLYRPVRQRLLGHPVAGGPEPQQDRDRCRTKAGFIRSVRPASLCD